jgi:steroid delta-isomerase-like uncharacterized protein
MSAEETKAVAQRWMDEVWQKASTAAMDDILASDFTFNYATPGVKPDRESYKQMVNDSHSSFPDVQFTTEDMVVEGEKAAIHWKGRGTHKGQLGGIPPTGKQVTLAGISIICVAGGKIIEEVGYSNMMELIQELGATPPSG